MSRRNPVEANERNGCAHEKNEGMMCGRRGEWPCEPSTVQRVACWRAIYATEFEVRWVLR